MVRPYLGSQCFPRNRGQPTLQFTLPVPTSPYDHPYRTSSSLIAKYTLHSLAKGFTRRSLDWRAGWSLFWYPQHLQHPPSVHRYLHLHGRVFDPRAR